MWIHSCTGGVRRVNAGSATLSAYVEACLAKYSNDAITVRCRRLVGYFNYTLMSQIRAALVESL